MPFVSVSCEELRVMTARHPISAARSSRSWALEILRGGMTDRHDVGVSRRDTSRPLISREIRIEVPD